MSVPSPSYPALVVVPSASERFALRFLSRPPNGSRLTFPLCSAWQRIRFDAITAPFVLLVGLFTFALWTVVEALLPGLLCAPRVRRMDPLLLTPIRLPGVLLVMKFLADRFT